MAAGTYKEAARKVLADSGEPLHAHEIARRALASGTRCVAFDEHRFAAVCTSAMIGWPVGQVPLGVPAPWATDGRSTWR